MLDRQLLFVTGKGGVGKTTVAAALGLAGARRHRRVIVCEVGGQARVPALLGADPAHPPAPGEEVQVAEHLWATTIDPRPALEEWIARILGSRSLTQLLARSSFFGAFVGAAPGAAELVTITKAWELAQRERWDRRARGYDLVVVDGPASGHGLAMLRTPGTYREIARVGPIATQAERVREFLGDSRRSAFVAVALAAEMPVTETIELGARLRRTIGRRLEGVVVNAVLPRRLTDAQVEAVREAAARDGRAGADAGLVADAMHGAWARGELQAEQLERLRAACDGPVTELPFLFADGLGAEHVRALSERLG